MSTGLPSGRNGMSSSGTMRATIPLLPWRPAILSPTEILRFSARYTFTSWMTPGGSSSGCRIRSIRSSAFSSSFAFSSLAASMIVRMRSFTFLSATRKVLRSSDEILRPSSTSCVIFVPAGIASSTVPLLSASATRLPDEQLAELARHALRSRGSSPRPRGGALRRSARRDPSRRPGPRCARRS